MAEENNPRLTLTPVDFDPFAEPEDAVRLPLTEEQAEMWTAVQMGPEASCSYNECLPLKLRGPLSIDALKSALRRLLGRHEALRVTFDPEGREQLVHSALDPEVALIDLSQLSVEARTSELTEILDRESRTPFDLEGGPLFRVQVVKTMEDEHVVVLSTHHIVCDGWSVGLLLSDLGALYAGEREGIPAVLPTVASYREHIRAASSDKTRAERQAAETYWAARLAGSIPVLEMPVDWPRPPVKTYRGNREKELIGADLSRDLKKVGAKNGCTLYVTLLAAFEVLLSRLTGQTDLLVGIPIAGQAQAENRNLVGHFVHTLPLRSTVDPARPFTEHLRATRDRLLAAQEHQETTFGSLVKKLNLPRDPGRTPLVAIIFNVDRIGTTPEFGGLAVEAVGSIKNFVNFELNLNIVDDGRKLVLECSYNTDLFGRATIERWMGHYRVLLEGIVRDPQSTIEALPLLTAAERRQMLLEWNATGLSISGDLRLHRLFEEQVRKTPGAEALVDQTERLSYGELNQRANRLAHRLVSLGVGPETLVGICLPRSCELVVAILAVLKAGGAYVPLDPAYPRERLAFMLEDARAAVLVTVESLGSILPERLSATVLLDAEREGIASQSAEDPVNGAQPSNLAYVIYTSGSTGKPKGVAIEHRSAATLVHWAHTVFPLRDLSGVLFSTSVCFDLSIFEMFVPLCGGGRVIVAENALQVSHLPAASEVTLVNTVPSAIAELLRERALPASVLTVNLAGEPLPTHLVDKLYALGHVERVFDLYGPSEDTTYSTYALRRSDEPPTIGRPIANTQVYILDGRMEPVPVGVVGEIYLGGDGLARGYLNRPELTAEKFVASPFGPPGPRLYRTGDLGRYRASGEIEFLGRGDNQVKLRGFRIELGEIESALASHPEVREAIVTVREWAEGDKRLVAYVASGSLDAGATAVLREHLAQRLPAYMIPGFFVFLEALPLTPNGKLDRKALPAPELPAREEKDGFVAPRTQTERVIAAIWQDVLGLERIGVYDNFFDLGGHSLLSAKVVYRIEQQLGRRLNPGELILQTLAQLAARCDRLAPQGQEPTRPATGLVGLLRRIIARR